MSGTCDICRLRPKDGMVFCDCCRKSYDRALKKDTTIYGAIQWAAERSRRFARKRAREGQVRNLRGKRLA